MNESLCLAAIGRSTLTLWNYVSLFLMSRPGEGDVEFGPDMIIYVL